MQTGLDRRTFLARAAVASGGLMSMGALERLVTRDAFAHGSRAQPYGPLRRIRGPAGRRGARAARRASATSRSATPARRCRTATRRRWRSTAWARSRAAARPRTRPRHGTTTTSCGSCATARTATPPGTPAACSATARRRTTRPASAARPRSSTTSAGAELVAGLREPQRHDGQLRGRHRLPPPLLAHRRGDRRRARTPPIPARASPSGTATCSRRRSTAAPNELEPGSRSPRPGRFSHEAAAVDQRTGIVYETEDPGSGVGAGFYRYTPNNPDDLTARRQARDARDHRPAERRPAGRPDARCSALPVSWVRIDEPGPAAHERRRPEQHLQSGLGEGRREVQPPRRLLGGRQHDLLRLHERRRREERRRQLRRLRGGLRPDLGLPRPSDTAAGR